MKNAGVTYASTVGAAIHTYETTTATARAQYLTSVMSSGETAAEAKLKAGRDKEIALADADLQKQLTGNETAYATAVNNANTAYDTATTGAAAALKSAKQTALSQLNSALAQSSKDKDTAIAGAERTYDQLVAALDAQYGASSSHGDTGIEGARRQAAISTRDAQYYASRDTSWAGTLSGSATIGNTPWTLKAITAANAQAAYSTNRARAQAAHDAALLSAIDSWQTSNRTSTLSLLVAEGQSREAYNKATATVFANWELGIGNLLGDKPEGTGWEGRTGENNTETTNGEYGGMGGFLNFNWFGEEDEEEEESDTPERPEEPSTAEYVNDNIVLYRDAIKSTPVFGTGLQSPLELWMHKAIRDWAVDMIAGGVAVSAHDTIKKVDPTANADSAFFLAWFGESSIPSLMTTNDRVNGQTAEFLQSLARDKAIELNRGHAGLGVSGTPFMDEVAIEAPTSLLSFGLPKMLGMGARVSKKISKEGIELVLDAARRVDDEAIEAAAKARPVLDNYDDIPLDKMVDEAPNSVGGWISRPEGTRLKQVGNYWIKEVDPSASAIQQWWGRVSLNAQARALNKLGDMATPHLFKNGKLVMRDAGQFDGSAVDFLSIRAKGSWRLGTPFNDLWPRNIGANGLAFDPALHPIHEGIYWVGTGVVIFKGGELLYYKMQGEE